MEICVCVKRVPMVGGAIVVTADGMDVDVTMSGFTVSPHEECAVEEAVQITERLGGTVSVLTLGPPDAAGQLRDMLALGAGRGVLLETDGAEWGPVATAGAIADAVRDGGYDLLLFGNEAADTGGYQVPVRVAHALGLPCVTGIKRLQVTGDGDPSGIVASREYRGAEEVFELPLPAVVSVKEGINLPRYPSLPGRLRAKRATIETVVPQPGAEGLRKAGLRMPEAPGKGAQLLGSGTEAVPALVGVLDDLGILP
ncbi:MAG TPA: electron transfer flavoprotein subunit beta/FixA family protein [Streptosporangiaceae bacterium]|nr:electron transfer flavoprotein subunit beta/FixA family protein [Streptosporangiaceae bacterium]